MRLCNPFKSLTWNSLLVRSRSRPRRMRRSCVPVYPAAEVLEVRSLLSGNVVATAVGTALTLTSDSGDNGVEVFRLNANTVEIGGLAGTTINGAASQTFALSSVFGITVNLGSGFDSYFISSRSGSPALNIGPGGILFQGAAGGGTGDDLQVFSDSSNTMTIGGSVIVQGSTPLSPLAHSGPGHSTFELFADSGNLTVLGSVFGSQSNSGSGADDNEVITALSGNLTVFGSVTELLAGPGSGRQENEVDAFQSGRISIGLGVTQTATSSTQIAENQVDAFNSSSISIGRGVTQTATSSTQTAANEVDAFDSGSISIGWGVTQTAMGSSSDNEVDAFTSGGVSIRLGVTQRATSSTSTAKNEVDDIGSGNVAIGLGVTQTATSSTATAENEFDDIGSGNVTIGLGVTQTATSTDFTENDVDNLSSSGGAITVGGLIIMNSTATGPATLLSINEIVSHSGDVSALGVMITDSGSEHMDNQVLSLGGGAVRIGLGGVTILGAGSGFHDNSIFANLGSSVAIAGSVVVTDTTAGTANQLLEIEGDTIIGGALLVTMNGPGARIRINDAGGFGTVEVKGLFSATMLGTSPVIIVGDDTGSGASPVKFDTGVSLLGSPGAGATFEYDPANVTTPFIANVFFTIVVS